MSPYILVIFLTVLSVVNLTPFWINYPSGDLMPWIMFRPAYLFEMKQGEYYQKRSEMPHLAVTAGQAALDSWKVTPSGIRLTVTVDSPHASLTLRHMYFPPLHLERNTGSHWEPISIRPEPETGMISFRLPRGMHELRLRDDILHPSVAEEVSRAWLLPYAWRMSGAAWALLLALFLFVPMSRRLRW